MSVLTMSQRVCRRKEPILGYVPKNYEKKNSGSKGLIESVEFSRMKASFRNSLDAPAKCWHGISGALGCCLNDGHYFIFFDWGYVWGMQCNIDRILWTVGILWIDSMGNILELRSVLLTIYIELIWQYTLQLYNKKLVLGCSVSSVLFVAQTIHCNLFVQCSISNTIIIDVQVLPEPNL